MWKIVFLILIPIISFCQNECSKLIHTITDKFTNKVDYDYSRLTDGNNNIHANLSSDNMFYLVIIAIHTCIDKNKEIQVLMDNGKILKLENNYQNNCAGRFDACLNCNNSDKERQFILHKIKAIRVTYENGYEYDVNLDNKSALLMQKAFDCLWNIFICKNPK